MTSKKTTIHHTDTNKAPVEIDEFNIDKVYSDINFFGRNVLELGEELNENLINVLENFAAPMDAGFLPTQTPFPTLTPTMTMTQTPTATPAPTVTPTPSSVPSGYGLAYLSNDNAVNSFEIGYGTFTGTTYEHKASKKYNAFALSTPGMRHACVSHNNIIFSVVPIDNNGPPTSSTSGIVALAYDGSSALVEVHKWQISPSITNYNEYWSMAKLNDGTIITATLQDETTDIAYLKAFTYAVATGFTEIASLTLPSTAVRDLIVHNNNLIAVTSGSGNSKTFTGYNISGATFVPTTSQTINTVGALYESNGSNIFTSNSNTLAYDGTTMSITQNSNSSIGLTGITIDTSRSMMIGQATTAIRAYNSSYGVVASLTFGTSHFCSLRPAYVNDYILIPAGTGYSANASGIYSWNGTAFSRIGPLIVTTSFTPTNTTLYSIPQLTIYTP